MNTEERNLLYAMAEGIAKLLIEQGYLGTVECLREQINRCKEYNLGGRVALYPNPSGGLNSNL